MMEAHEPVSIEQRSWWSTAAPLAALRRVAAAAAAFVALAAVLAGCASVPPPNLKAPELSITHVSLARLGFETTRFEVLIEAWNPNAEDLPLSDVRLDLSLMGIALGSGTLPTDQLLLAGTTATRVPVTFAIPTARLLDVGLRLKTGGLSNAGYRLDGSARWGATGYRMPMVKEGNLDLLRRLGQLIGF
jgi:hypothetical protein